MLSWLSASADAWKRQWELEGERSEQRIRLTNTGLKKNGENKKRGSEEATKEVFRTKIDRVRLEVESL